MRPIQLQPLFQSAKVLKGIGPKLEKTLLKLFSNIPKDQPARVLDLLLHMPASAIDRRNRPPLTSAPVGEVVTLKVLIDEHLEPSYSNSRAPYKVSVHDETGSLTLVFFHAHGDWLQKMLPIGEERYISGTLESYGGELSMAHPDHIVSEDDFATLPLVEPIYPMTAGLSPKTYAKAVKDALLIIPELQEWGEASVLKQHKWPDFRTALQAVHAPDTIDDMNVESLNWQRLAYDELLANQLALALMRSKMKRARGIPKVSTDEYTQGILKALPFELTGSQSGAIAEISQDIASKDRMLRLLQGDVGAGKTVVALMAMVQAAEAGAQSAIMAPTEILARQHIKSIEPLAKAVGLKAEILTGREKGAKRREILQGLEDGSIDFLIGTHALFQEGINFKNLGLAVIDEQHRFGVQQRLSLTNKGAATDLLVMTATPIPRTLVLTYFGDMDVSKLMGKPKGRKPIETSSASMGAMDTIIKRLANAINNGEKAYWVCPLVEESELIDLTASEDRAIYLKQNLPPELRSKVGLIHGKMTSEEKDAAMAAFQQGETKILVATTVIEVGVDVPDATIIIIEHAERFGLSQLHQLRGRVGRGSKSSKCLLIYAEPLGEVAKARINVMKETEDGFLIAEEDLRLRGEGDVLGTKQSGMPGFKIARLEYHAQIMELARQDARLVIETDPELTGKRGAALRALLYLFERDEAIRMLKAG